jgi:tetratricopeptide (TPR) repeat protein
MKNEISAAELAHRANVAMESGNFSKALEDLKQAIELRPEWFLPYFSRGLVLSRMGRGAEAVTEYSQAIKLNSQESGLYLYRGKELTKTNRAEALSDFNETINLQPSFAEAYLERAKLHEIEGRNLEALTDYSKSLLFNSKQKNALEALERVQTKLLEQYNRQIEEQPANAPLYSQRGLFLRTIGKAAEAEKDFIRAVELEPTNADFYGNLGVIQAETNKPHQALESFAKALELNAALTVYRASRAVVLLELSQVVEALDDLQIALEAEPENSDFLLLRAKAKRISGELADTREDLLKLADKFKNAPVYFDEYGTVLFGLKEYDAASTAFGTAFKLEPTAQRAYQMAVALTLAEKYENALEFYDLILLQDPYNPAANNERGAVLEKLNRSEEAFAAYQKAVQSNPDYQPARDNAARLSA